MNSFPTVTRAQWLLVAVMLAASLLLRGHGLGRFPAPYETLDEQSYVWCGATLLDEGRPTSWILLTGYKGEPKDLGKIRMPDGKGYSLVRPALAHPPLYSLWAGGFARLAGAERVMVRTSTGAEVRLWKFNVGGARVQSLLIYVCAFGLLFDIAFGAFGFGAASLALAFFGFLAPVVAHQRLIVADNLSTVFLLLQLSVLLRYLDGRAGRGLFITVTVLATAAALLCKVVAVSQAGAAAAMLLAAGRRREIIWPVAGAALGVAIYALYGWWQGWSEFTGVLRAQSGRFMGFGALLNFLTRAKIVHTLYFNGAVFAGWICALALPLVLKQAPPALFALPGYLIMFAFFSDADSVFGWHALPFYPLLCLALGATVVMCWEMEGAVGSLALAMLLLPFVFQFVYAQGEEFHAAAHWAFPFAACALAAAAGLGGPGLRLRVTRHLIAVSVAVALWMNIAETLRYSAAPG